MLNEKLIHQAHGMLLDRFRYFQEQERKSKNDEDARFNCMLSGAAAAYKSAYDILWYAINNNEEILKEFDYYAD